MLILRVSMCFLWSLVALMGGLSIQATAQSLDAPARIAPGDTLIILLSGAGAAYFIYEAAGGEALTITVRGLGCGRADACTLYAELDESLMRDTIVEVLNPQMRRLAYNDSHRSVHPDLAPGDSMIEGLLLTQAGPHLIRVDTYGGIFNSEVEITLAVVDLFDISITEEDKGTIITGALPPHRAFSYVFNAAEGAILTFSARDLAGGLDLRLLLLDAEGETLAENDDHGSYDLGLGMLDPKIADFVIPVTGEYRLVLVDFIGRAGRFEILLERR